jgi:hypothetical protein
MPHARTLDPSTSHQAAASVRNIGATHQAILKVLSAFALTDLELVTYYNNAARKDDTVPRASESGIRSRRAELVELGLVMDTGRREKLASGRAAIVWTAV